MRICLQKRNTNEIQYLLDPHFRTVKVLEDSGIPRCYAMCRGHSTYVDCSKKRSASISRVGPTKPLRQRHYFFRRSRSLLNYPLRGVISHKMTIIIIIIIIIISNSVHNWNLDCMPLLKHSCSSTPIPRFLHTCNCHRRRPLASYTLQSLM